MAAPTDWLPAHEIARLVESGEARVADIVDRALERIESADSSVNAFLHVDRDGARRRAEELDAKRDRGESLGPLAGVPIAVKDNLCTHGVTTTAGSRILESFVPPYDATAVARLRDAGAVLIGKVNLDEFAMGSSCENSAFHPTRNPWNLECVPGGSSGGSAAAVAAGLVPVAIGSDTGGSIRQPSALCGVSGLKPTYGRISRYGLIAFASSLDQIGPLARDARDLARTLGVLAGPDPRDGTAVDRPVPDYEVAVDAPDLTGLRLGVPAEYFPEDRIRPEIAQQVRAAIDRLESLGATVREVSLPHTPHAVAAYYVVANSEASSNLARFDGVRYGRRAETIPPGSSMVTRSRSEGFGAEVKRRIMLGTYALSAGYYDAYYKKGLQARALLRRDFERAFEEVDALVAPTSPIPAFRLGEKADDPLEMYLCDILTTSCNLAGIPGLSIPCGFVDGGLPVGLQILGAPFDEGTLLRIAAAYQQTTDHHQKRPPVAESFAGGAA